MDFDLTPGQEQIQVRTCSTYDHAEARDPPQYVLWYKGFENPDMTDGQFLDQNGFTISLDDFAKRFAPFSK